MTPTDFMIEMMNDMDEIEDVFVVRLFKDGRINYGSASNSRFHYYAMVCGAKAYLEASFVKTEIEE